METVKYSTKEEKAYFEKYFDFIPKQSELEEMFFEFSAFLPKDQALQLTTSVQYKILEQYKNKLESNVRLFEHRLTVYNKEMKKNRADLKWYYGSINNMKNVKAMTLEELSRVKDELIKISKDKISVNILNYT